jgi:hypothetical protein
MLEIVVSETQKVFVKAINKFAKDALLDQTQVSFLLSLKDGAEGKEVKYEVCHEYVPIRETNIKEILGVKKIDFKGYTYFIPPRIKQILEDFAVAMKSEDVEVAVFLNREDEDKIRYFLYSGGTYVKEFNLEDVLKFEIEQT